MLIARQRRREPFAPRRRHLKESEGYEMKRRAARSPHSAVIAEIPEIINRYRITTAAVTPESQTLMVVAISEGAGKADFAAPALDEALIRHIQREMASHFFRGKPGECHRTNLPTGRCLLIGAGKKPDAGIYRWMGGQIAAAAKDCQGTAVRIHRGMIPHAQWPAAVEAITEGIELASFSFDVYKSIVKEATAPARAITYQFAAEGLATASLNHAIHRSAQIASAVNFARHLANQPPNVINPSTLTAICQTLAKRLGLKLRVVGYAEAAKLSMGGLCAVGKGSPNKPALIILEHKPSKVGGKDAVAIVGKAVTFDTGGISIKPAADMGAMKYDKCGGMAAIGVLCAAALLKMPRHVIGVIPTAENMVDGDAYRPGDIIHMYNNKTVDITNTDAEGRLILADAIGYACKAYGAKTVIDMATLTGGVITALGGVYGGLMSNNDALAQRLIEAGQATDEWVWRLPLHERYRKLLDSPHADMVNSGNREAHAIQGGMFLQEFVPDGIHWAHLDIAGVAHPRKDHRYLKGEQASGFGVRLIMHYLTA